MGDATDIYETEEELREALRRAWDQMAIEVGHVGKLNELLDHYRGICSLCGRANVLLEAHDWGNYDGELYYACWEDPEECQRIQEEYLRSEAHKRSEAAKRGWETRRRKERRARVAAGTADMGDRLVTGLEDAYEPVFKALRDRTATSPRILDDTEGPIRFEWNHMPIDEIEEE